MVSNATFVFEDYQHGQAHQNVDSGLNISMEMEEVGGNDSDLEFENIPEEEEVLIPNAKKQ